MEEVGGLLNSMKKRIVSIELLRIIAMMMVVMLHYLGKGELLQDLTGELTLNGYVAWGMEALCIVAVNVYMLISGYVLVNSEFKLRRLIELICQVLFYTILVEGIAVAVGLVEPGSITLNRVLELVFPFQMKHYWFMTAYIIMYLFSPILGTAVHHMEKKQLWNVIVTLLVFFSISKSVLPVELMVDQEGYDALWFICVYLVAAYIRLYGLPIFEKSKVRGLLCYFMGCVGILGITFLVRAVYLRTGSLDHFIGSAFHYNHIFALLAAVGLFYLFLNMKMPADKKGSQIICKIAPYSLGVYLLHEHLEIRYLWPEWLGANGDDNILAFIIRCVIAVLIVYVIGTLVDMVRKYLFTVLEKVLCKVIKKA